MVNVSLDVAMIAIVSIGVAVVAAVAVVGKWMTFVVFGRYAVWTDYEPTVPTVSFDSFPLSLLCPLM